MFFCLGAWILLLFKVGRWSHLPCSPAACKKNRKKRRHRERKREGERRGYILMLVNRRGKPKSIFFILIKVQSLYPLFFLPFCVTHIIRHITILTTQSLQLLSHLWVDWAVFRGCKRVFPSLCWGAIKRKALGPKGGWFPEKQWKEEPCKPRHCEQGSSLFSPLWGSSKFPPFSIFSHFPLLMISMYVVVMSCCLSSYLIRTTPLTRNLHSCIVSFLYCCCHHS